MSDDELPPHEPPDKADWIGPALGRAHAPLWTENDKRKKQPPIVRYIHEGNTGRYFCLSNGLVVKHSNESGAWICLYSRCLNSRQYADCEHVSLAQDYARNTPPEPVQHDPDRHPFPEG